MKLNYAHIWHCVFSSAKKGPANKSVNMESPTVAPAHLDEHWFGHPKGLYFCFLTEMWERFSYYGMRALLVFYLTQHFLFSDTSAFLIYGAYTSLVYMAPVIGGVLADKYLGMGKAVTFGAILLVLGHFGMAFEGPASESVGGEVLRNPFYTQIFYLSLAFIIVGVGFLKPNISSIVGELYPQNDPRRDGGFTIFYMGINIGAFSSSLLCGWLGQTYGWSYGFGLAGIGMLFGLIIFNRGQRYFNGAAEPTNPEFLKEKTALGISKEYAIYLSGILMIIAAWQLVQHQAVVGQMLGMTGILAIAVIIIYAFKKCTPVERDRLGVASALIIFSVIFWALFEQAASSLNIFADRAVNREVFGWEMPASMLQSINPAFIFIFAPLMSMLWPRLAAKGIEPNTPQKFAIAIALVGLGFLTLVFGGAIAGESRIALIWIFLIYWFHTMGELCLSPVGLSMITKLSVRRIVGMMMGIWFLASAGANYIAALIATATSSEPEAGQTAVGVTLEVYARVGWLALTLSVLLFLLAPLLKKGMHGVR